MRQTLMWALEELGQNGAACWVVSMKVREIDYGGNEEV